MSDKEYIKDALMGLGGALLLLSILVIILCSSCKLFKQVEKSNSDSTKVEKQDEVNSKVDTSKTKNESTATKETVYYPQPIYIQGKDGETKVVFVPQSTKETEVSKSENQNAVFEEWKRHYEDSTQNAQSNLSKDVKVKAGPSFIEWLLIIAIGLLFIKIFLPFKIIKT